MNQEPIGFEKYFQQVVDLPEEAMAELQTHWIQSTALDRKEFLDYPGKIADQLYYVLEGELWIYYQVEEKEICVGLAYADTLLSSAASFLSGAPSRFYIQAVSPVRLTGIKKSDLLQLVDAHPTLERAWRKMTEFALLGRFDREYEMLSLAPEDRYRNLWKRSPQVFQLFPQKILASYLGMTPEHFSRVKRKVTTS